MMNEFVTNIESTAAILSPRRDSSFLQCVCRRLSAFFFAEILGWGSSLRSMQPVRCGLSNENFIGVFVRRRVQL